MIDQHRRYVAALRNSELRRARYAVMAGPARLDGSIFAPWLYPAAAPKAPRKPARWLSFTERRNCQRRSSRTWPA